MTPPLGTTDPVPGNNTASDTNPVGPEADLLITKSSTPNPYVPGAGFTYTITVTNSGLSDVVNARVQDALPAAISGFGWTCTPNGAGASCGTTNGTGNIDALVTLPAGTNAVFSVTGTVPSETTGTLLNAVTVTPPLGTTDPVPGNNTASDTNPVGPEADLLITKSSTPNPYVPGAGFTYTITVTNSGLSDVVNARVQDALPAAISGFGWTCTPNGAGASCGTTNGTGNIDALVTLPAGTNAVFSVTGTVPSETTGTLLNAVTVTPPLGTTDPVPGNNTASDTNPVGPEADLLITKSSTPNPYVPGAGFTYTITVTNSGLSDVVNARVQDALPAAISGFGWTCTPNGAGASCGTTNGTGNIDALITLPVGVGINVTFSVTGTMPSGTTGSLVNTASVSVPAGTTDTDMDNNSATDTATAASSAPSADSSITKSDSATEAVPGNSITYTITVTNNGPSDVTGATVNDTMPATLTSVTWTCTASSGSSCTASGSGDISDTVNLLAGGTATYTVLATISASATGSLVNTASVTAPTEVTDPAPNNNTATEIEP